MTESRPLVVFSHLRWDFVYQRPQHLLTRLAKYRPVLFIEEPEFDAHESGWRDYSPEPNLRVMRPLTSIPEYGFTDAQIARLLPMVRALGRQERWARPVAWLYTPLAAPLADALDPAAVVFDCMDELSAFAGASAQLVRREAELLARADLVFTGGRSLYRAKRDHHPRVYCFPSSVDAAHFARARNPLPEPEGQANLPRPRLGFFGVIDERMDADLLAQVAEVRPDWTIVMIGPVVKIDPATLPQKPNLHYLGGRDYARLPDYVAGWDVCLMPFALNEATRFISPTKTLEYLAADKPIVSTPIRDVADGFPDLVRIAADANGFVAGCAAALAESESERGERIRATRAVLAETSWDATAETMNGLIEDVVGQPESGTEPEPGPGPVSGPALTAILAGEGRAATAAE